MSNRSNYNLSKFGELVNDTTKDFKRISIGLADVANFLQNNGYEQIADMIVSLQKSEEDRLHLCASLQLARQEAGNSPDAESLWSKVSHLQELYSNIIQKINEQMERIRYQTDKIAY
ncbi:hypothetical protein SSS_08117 [Sarcoptes scabiei]|uniref:DNA repair REX1-B-like protein n=1 Tax=Sarcoptes scabiei TaxID=52283 RepID=A0A132ACN3_SARSC|nr:hypothetical protein SSS_08117 [Sarcoptes scabiei]KPM08629.1 DNA repair REX1-B-like protein [Sarcoptes scabiei]